MLSFFTLSCIHSFIHDNSDDDSDKDRDDNINDEENCLPPPKKKKKKLYIHTSNIYCIKSKEPVLHDWCNKGRGMCYPVCGMVHIKKTLLLINKSSLCGGSGFPCSLSEWSLTICLTPYNRR